VENGDFGAEEGWRIYRFDISKTEDLWNALGCFFIKNLAFL
jgi:hypothetical protein